PPTGRRAQHVCGLPQSGDFIKSWTAAIHADGPVAGRRGAVEACGFGGGLHDPGGTVGEAEGTARPCIAPAARASTCCVTAMKSSISTSEIAPTPANAYQR